MAVAEVEKARLVVADVAELVIPTAQVQQIELLGKFVVLLLCAEIGLAVLLSAVLRQVIAMVPLKKAGLASTEVAAFLLGSGNLLNCIFFAFVFFCLAIENMY